MKRELFLILVSILFILVLIYFYDKREEVLNKQYEENTNHIHIEYPYFHNQIIDNYLNYYLNNYINTELEHNLFIDYDYFNHQDIINLTMYIYEEYENVVKENKKSYKIKLSENKINPTNFIWEETIDNNFNYQKQFNKNKPMIALTFDDGPNHNTNKILDILEKHHIKATFFILGCNIIGNENIIKRMEQLDMEIGNHMYSHKLLTKLTNNEIKSEIEKVDNLIFNIINKNPSLIRPSYGTYNNRIKKIMNRPIIIWNVDSLDWKYHNSKKIYKRVMESISDGDIILMHDIYNATANSLELIIPKLLENEYQFMTVSELLHNKGIDIKKGRVYSNAN